MKPSTLFWIIIFLMSILLYLDINYFIILLITNFCILLLSQFIMSSIQFFINDVKDYRYFYNKKDLSGSYEIFISYNIFFYIFYGIKLFNKYLNEKFA